MFIAEEMLLDGKYCDPLFMVGMEGFWGLCYWCILLPIFQTVDCETGPFCTYGYLENTSLSFY